MFKLSAKRRLTWPVTVNVPLDGGATRKERFEVEFEVLTSEEQDKVIQESRDLLDAQLVAWPDGKGPLGEDGQPVPFSAEAKAALLAVNHARVGLFNALTEINTGRAAARKN